eukprot:5406727-Lingulodinium_polyedra.AAC.1
MQQQHATAAFNDIMQNTPCKHIARQQQHATTACGNSVQQQHATTACDNSMQHQRARAHATS